MSTIETTRTVGPDGSAHLDTPVGLPAGFFAQTYGSCGDDPLPEAGIGPVQEREPIE